MVSLGLFVRLEAKPGKERDVVAFLKQGLQMVNQEATTELWFALRLGPSTFAILDALANEAERQTHLNGPIAKALFANTPNLLAVPRPQKKLRFLERSFRRWFESIGYTGTSALRRQRQERLNNLP